MKIQIDRITLRELRLPLKEPFQISSGTVFERRILLFELEDASGAVSWSECVAAEQPNYSPETIDTSILVIREYLAKVVLGQEFGHPSEVHGALEKAARGHPMAKGALEMGAWALAAEAHGTSLSALLGGTRKTVPTGISLGIQDDPAALVEKAQDALAQGYRKIKLKIKPGQDVEYVAAVRDALGEKAPLMVDANSAYTPADTAQLRKLDDLGLTMIEQPLFRDDLVRHAALQRELRTPICLDESIVSASSAEDALTLKSCRIINIKPGRVGGFTSSKAIHDLCEATGVPVWCGGMLESGVGRAHNVALASLPNFKMPGDISPSARYWEQDIVKPEWTMSDDGMVTVPVDRPGLGVEVDRDRVDELTVRKDVLGE